MGCWMRPPDVDLPRAAPHLRPTTGCTEKIVFWIRHGHSEYNAEQERALASCQNVNTALKHKRFFDTPLSVTGRAQAEALGERMHALGVELVATSPLRRALQTAALAFPKKAIHVLELLRERHSGSPVDCRRSHTEIAVDLAGLHGSDLSGLQGDADPFPCHVEEHGINAAARGQRALDWVLGRPEQRIAVVSHGWLLQLGLLSNRSGALLEFEETEAQASLGKPFGNCEVRAMRLDPRLSVGGRQRTFARSLVLSSLSRSI